MARLALEYFGLVFLACVGVLQAAAAYNGLKGLSFLGQRLYGYLFAAFTVGPALAFFFTWNGRNPTGVIEGKEQFGFFMLGLIAAVVFTLAGSSLLRSSLLQGNPGHDGLDALREVTFFKALRRRFVRRR